MGTESIWLLVGFLAFVAWLTITCILRALATYYQYEIEVHDCVRVTNQIRRQYLASLSERRGDGA